MKQPTQRRYFIYYNGHADTCDVVYADGYYKNKEFVYLPAGSGPNAGYDGVPFAETYVLPEEAKAAARKIMFKEIKRKQAQIERILQQVAKLDHPNYEIERG